MIVAHHVGEELLPGLVAGGAATGSMLLVALAAMLDRLRRGRRARGLPDR